MVFSALNEGAWFSIPSHLALPEIYCKPLRRFSFERRCTPVTAAPATAGSDAPGGSTGDQPLLR
jgi:hypothetical protein